MLIGEIIQRVQSLYSKGVQSLDNRLMDRHIYNAMLSVRSKLLTQKLNKKQKLSAWDYQTIPCIELEKASAHDCPCVPEIGCQILKSVAPLPKPLTGLNHSFIQSVTSLDGSLVFSEISWKEIKYKKGSKYTKYKPDFFIRNEHLYVITKSAPKVLTLVGLFEDPLQVMNFPSFCPEEDCVDCVDCESYLDKEFPLEDSVIQTLIELCVNELVLLFSKMKENPEKLSAIGQQQQ